MGLIGALVHTLLKTTLASLIITVIMVGFLEIPMGKMPLTLVVVLVANIVASLIASVLLTWQRGY